MTIKTPEKVFCTECGTETTLKEEGKIPVLNIYYYAGHCPNCNTFIFLTDRSTYKSEGQVYVERR